MECYVIEHTSTASRIILFSIQNCIKKHCKKCSGFIFTKHLIGANQQAHVLIHIGELGQTVKVLDCG